ncbi:MAG TPA: glycosyltransferase family 4 protein [Ktedonobacterales bacterium]|nr:glycosyltransferase family 4 protein [Ktedonobacterales bacterium]
MKILICNNRYFPSSGPERYLFAMTALLERHGHTVVPFAADYAQTLDTPYRRYFVPPPVDGESIYFKQYKDRLTLRKRLDLTARAAYSPMVRRAAERVIREERIELVYLLNTVNVLSPSVVDAAHALGVPVVMRLSDFNLLCPAYAFLRDGHVCQECLGGYHHALRHRCLQGSLAVTGARVLAMSIHRALGIYHRVGAFIAPSRYMAEQVETHFAPARGRVHHIPSFVDQTLLDALADLPTPTTGAPGASGRPYILFFGRVSPDKGVETLLRAYAGLEREVDLVIAGDSGDGYRQRMEALAAELGTAGTVRFVGFVSGAPLAELIAGALCVTAPSLWHDNAPMTVYESLAHGKAVVGSNLGGIAEQLEGGCGLTVPPGDPDALRAALLRLVEEPELRAELERAARSKALNDYAPERHYERVMAVFDTVRGGKGRREPQPVA